MKIQEMTLISTREKKKCKWSKTEFRDIQKHKLRKWIRKERKREREKEKKRERKREREKERKRE